MAIKNKKFSTISIHVDTIKKLRALKNKNGFHSLGEVISKAIEKTFKVK